MNSIHVQIKTAAEKRILFLPHAIRQMTHPDRMIAPEDVIETVLNGEIIEDYPSDVRGHSCLVLGFDAAQRPIHVVCAPKVDYLAIITAYIPDRKMWSADFRRRLP